MADVFVSDASMIPFGKKGKGAVELAYECASRITVRPDIILFASMSCMNSDRQGNASAAVAGELGLSDCPSFQVDTSSSSGAALVQLASFLLCSGRYDSVLAIASDNLTRMRSPEATAFFASVLPPHERDAGCTMPSVAALLWSLYSAKYGADEKSLMSVSIKNHKNGLSNPYAHIRKNVTAEDYEKSRIVSSPLRVLDCAPVSDGAAAILLTRKGGVRISGMGHACDTMSAFSRPGERAFRAVSAAARDAYAGASIVPGDIDFAELHDAFTPFEIMETEALGFCEEGQGFKAAMDGETSPEGSIPVNLSGGLKSRGHPVSVSGLAQMVEIYYRLTGTDYAKTEGRRALSLSIGGAASNNFVTILEV
ncbi:MAG: thiolase family protein [Methanomassiliicoccales archaeon]